MVCTIAGILLAISPENSHWTSLPSVLAARGDAYRRGSSGPRAVVPGSTVRAYAGGAPAQAPSDPGILELATSTDTRPLLTPSDLQAFLPVRGRFTFPVPYNTTGVRLTNEHDCSDFYDCVNTLTGGLWRNMNNSTGSNFLYIVIGLDRTNGGVGPSLFRYNKVTG